MTRDSEGAAPGDEDSLPELDVLEPYVIEDPDLLTHFHHAKVGQITVRFTQLEVLLKILASHICWGMCAADRSLPLRSP